MPVVWKWDGVPVTIDGWDVDEQKGPVVDFTLSDGTKKWTRWPNPRLTSERVEPED